MCIRMRPGSFVFCIQGMFLLNGLLFAHLVWIWGSTSTWVCSLTGGLTYLCVLCSMLLQFQFVNWAGVRNNCQPSYCSRYLRLYLCFALVGSALSILEFEGMKYLDENSAHYLCYALIGFTIANALAFLTLHESIPLEEDLVQTRTRQVWPEV